MPDAEQPQPVATKPQVGASPQTAAIGSEGVAATESQVGASSQTTAMGSEVTAPTGRKASTHAPADAHLPAAGMVSDPRAAKPLACMEAGPAASWATAKVQAFQSVQRCPHRCPQLGTSGCSAHAAPGCSKNRVLDRTKESKSLIWEIQNKSFRAVSENQRFEYKLS